MIASRDTPDVPTPQTMLLAQTDPTPLLIAIGVLIVAVIVGGIALMLVRNAASKRFLGSGAPRSGGLGLMEEMRRLRDSGAMSAEEYDRVRSNLIDRARGPETSEGDEDGPESATAPGVTPDPSPNAGRDPDRVVAGPGSGAPDEAPRTETGGEPAPPEPLDPGPSGS